ncbi:MAG: AAA family ATPase [Deltaproteobacteria bacterium]|nr:AAA family ATPase [Deltaproteobacteria bacterium]
MKCLKCQFENPEGIKFCGKCGAKLEQVCPQCKFVNPVQFEFCGECGQALGKMPAATIPATTDTHAVPISDHERKHVTILFSDLSGYTAMTEKLDPEEVKEIMDRIFGKISQVVVKYEGFIEKFIGDAVMAIFGVPKTHEDDPVRAIRAAREIHDLVREISPSLEKTIGRPLYMHTGINTGLVVARDIDFEKGTHGVLGDTINIASRLSGMAKTDEIIVGYDTYQHAERYFEFKKKKAVKIKGKEESIQIYRVLLPKEAPSKTHRLSGLRSELIGRKVEMGQLKDAVENLHQGKSTIFSIIGDAGTGKSRLVEEFKSSLDVNTIQWREGHSYGYSQNIPYFPLIDLLNRAWQIREGDSLEQLKLKMEKGATAVIGERKDLIPYLGRLYSLSYSEIEQVNPESWKSKLNEAMQLILANLCKRAPTIICIEDLHWADSSSLELLRNTLMDLRYPVLFICICRPAFSLFTSHQINSIKSYYEIRLHDLTPTDAQDMVESLLKTDTIPKQLRTFIRDKAEGNPFYLEEVINSLIETETLVRDNVSWKLTRPITDKDIPSTVQGVISARLDRLERETKRILQEASVIGRSFLYEILKRISDLKQFIDKSLMNLEQLDLIKTRSLQPELEYIFKHALTQEVVYQGLLIKERRSIHEKIGLVMEELFHDRLPEFYEILAYHYSQSENYKKACEYLKLSGDKAARNYANWEAIQFYKEAIQVLNTQPETEEIKRLKLEHSFSIIAVMMLLSYPEGSLEILQDAERLSQELGDTPSLTAVYSKLSIYHTLKGASALALEYTEKYFNEAEKTGAIDILISVARDICPALFFSDSYIKLIDIASRATRPLEENHSEKDFFTGGVNAYAAVCGWYGMSLGWLGKRREAKAVLEKGLKVAFEVNDRYEIGFLNFAYSSMSFYSGDGNTTIEHARTMVKHFEEAGTNLMKGIAWSLLGGGYYLMGDYKTAKDHAEKGLKIQKEVGLPSSQPWNYFFLAIIHYALGNMQSATDCIEQTLKLSQEFKMKTPEGMAWILIGRIKSRTNPADFNEAYNNIHHGISMLEEIKLKPLAAFGYVFLGEMLADADRKVEALESLKKAEALYREMEVTPESYWLVRTQNALRRLESDACTTH